MAKKNNNNNESLNVDIEKYIQSGRDAMKRNNWVLAEECYSFVEEIDHFNIEAVFGSAFARARLTLLNEDMNERKKAFSDLGETIILTSVCYRAKTTEENLTGIVNMGGNILELVCDESIFTEWKNGYGFTFKESKNETQKLYTNLVSSYYALIITIKKHNYSPIFNEILIAFLRDSKKCSYLNTKALDEWISVEENEKKSYENGSMDINNNKIQMNDENEKKSIENSSMHTKNEETKANGIGKEYFRMNPDKKKELENNRALLVKQAEEHKKQLEEILEKNQVESERNYLEQLIKQKESLGPNDEKKRKELEKRIENQKTFISTLEIEQNKLLDMLHKSVEGKTALIKQIDKMLDR